MSGGKLLWVCVGPKSIYACCVALFVVMLPLCLASELHLIYDANGNLVTGDGKYRVYNGFNQL
jgi:hypothetical protein